MSTRALAGAARRWHVGVVVPARDEADRIGAAVTSIRRSLSATPSIVGTIVVVADHCSDDTAAVAQRALGAAGVVLEASEGCVGRARARGTEAALTVLGSPLRHTWLLTTDADSTVPVDWVRSHLAIADAGAAAVAGIVRVDDLNEHPPAVAERFARTYVTNPDGSHPHVHGANLGVRADAYRAVGGWPSIPTGEDHALWQRIRAVGWPTVSSIDAWVTTSGRRVGRAPAGFADHLAELLDPALDPTTLVRRPERIELVP